MRHTRLVSPALLLVALRAFAVTADIPADIGGPIDKDATWLFDKPGAEKSFVTTGQSILPEGEFLRIPGRVLAMEFARGGKVLLVKTSLHIVSVNPATMTVISKLPFPDNEAAGMAGLAVSPDGARAYVTGGTRRLLVTEVAEDGKLAFGNAIDLLDQGKSVAPIGLALTPDGKRAVVALSKTNEVGIIDLATGKLVARVPVGVCPYGVAVSRDGRTAFVSNYGGDRPKSGEATENSAGSRVAVNERSLPLRGTVTPVSLDGTPKAGESIVVGLHPGELLIPNDGASLFVANVGGDSVSIVDTKTHRVTRTIDMKASPELPFGTLCDGLAISDDGKTLFSADAGINAVAQISLADAKPAPRLTASGYYPGTVRVSDGAVFTGCVLGGVQKFKLSADAAEIAARDQRARDNARLAAGIRASIRAKATGVAPKPVPDRLGEPSVIRHCVYVIKENKTYDQMLGDIGKGNSDPKLCMYSKKVTPNHHALANDFVLLDNYYCNGLRSSDGHAWSDQGMTTPYRERDFQPAERCGYFFGTDALTYASCGFLWDHALMNGRSFRNYGELNYASLVKGKTYNDFFTDRQNGGGKTSYKMSCQIEMLKHYSCPDYPGWNMAIPDQTRADVFIKELAKYEKTGDFPDITIVYLPNDHTAGELTANSYLADNDLALGRVVEAISKSRFWKDTAIFVNEDDPQSGHDHVDGHRSLCFVISPWAKRNQIVSRFYNQNAVIHTICRIQGLAPLNRMVAGTPTMEDCFQSTPDLTPYKALTPEIPLNQQRKKAKVASSWTPGIFLDADERLERAYAGLDFSMPDVIDEDVLNRYNWAQAKPGEPYPVAFVGAHGKGLAALGLQLDHDLDDDGDDD